MPKGSLLETIVSCLVLVIAGVPISVSIVLTHISSLYASDPRRMQAEPYARKMLLILAVIFLPLGISIAWLGLWLANFQYGYLIWFFGSIALFSAIFIGAALRGARRDQDSMSQGEENVLQERYKRPGVRTVIAVASLIVIVFTPAFFCFFLFPFYRFAVAGLLFLCAAGLLLFAGLIQRQEARRRETPIFPWWKHYNIVASLAYVTLAGMLFTLNLTVPNRNSNPFTSAALIVFVPLALFLLIYSLILLPQQFQLNQRKNGNP